jgi:hypothetical protein
MSSEVKTRTDDVAERDKEIERLRAALRLIHAETKDGVAFNIARKALLQQ